ncbi:MAG: hypothetical protein KDA84_07860 [Planctomycetaceae bacterium]|nr:hypothetical protein [Planctomycetaceae bacterium]
MRLGIDFDNTLVQYDDVFHRAAIEKALIPESSPKDKTQIRAFIREQHGPDAWTELQGYVYGQLIEQAQPFDEALRSLQRCKQAGVSLLLISHKTEWPVLGPKWNLREAAKGWLLISGLWEENSPHNLLEEIWFEETRDGKLNRIASCACDVFIDDLPDILTDPCVPESSIPILFDPATRHCAQNLSRLRTWADLPALLEALELI